MTSKEKKNNDNDMSPLGKFESGMPWNAVEKTIFERRSIRVFKKKQLPDSMIRRILEAGRFAPSAANCQPWKFMVITSVEVIEAMERDALKMARIIMWFLDYSRTPFRQKYLAPLVRILIRFQYRELNPVPFGAMQQMAAGKLPVFHGAPVLVLIFIDRRGVSNPYLDAGICGQNMVLAAHSMGAGSCWIGFIKLLLYYPKWRKFFGLKYPYDLTDCIAFGWPKGEYDGIVPREIQLVQWVEGGITDRPRTEKQGDIPPCNEKV